jgi:hypothetical protein
VTCWLTLFDGDGEMIAEWAESCGDEGGAIVIDSRRVREQFGLGEFAGQLFIHIVGAAGHDIVKYALDFFGEEDGVGDGALSCTHDANAWPSDRYAGLPAPGPGERVILWVQNSHPIPIPAGAIELTAMGEEAGALLPAAIGPFASRAVDVAALLPGLAWPRQIELRAGKHVVRPRYEVIAEGRRRVAHVNVERADLAPDPLCPPSPKPSARAICCPRRSCRARNGRASCSRPRWRSRSGNCRLPLSSTMPRAMRSRACRSAACRATTPARYRLTLSGNRSAPPTAISS